MLPVFAILVTIIKVVVAFSVLIMIHEFGHFIVAKKSGVWVEEFGLGLPPRIFGKKIGETIYSINWLPIGGFVRLHGETNSDEVVYPKRAFTKKRPLTKIAITIAGIFMNFVLAVICFAIIFFSVGIPGDKTSLVITSVSDNSPAQVSGLTENDIIQKINNVSVATDSELKTEIDKNKGKETSVEIKRNNKNVTLQITPRLNPPAGEGSLGISFTSIKENYFPPLWQRPFISAWHGLKQTYEVAKATVFGLGTAAQSVSQGKPPQGLSGPVGIIAIFKKIAEEGILELLSLEAVISINLAIINLIPFPPLDGSRIALVIAERLTKKKMTPKLEEKVYLFGFAVLIGLMILITSREIPALIRAGGVDKYASELLNPK